MLIDYNQGFIIIRSWQSVETFTFLILLDHLKAFNTIDPETAIYKLKHLFNFSENATKLVSSYLDGRNQSVYHENKISEALPVVKGVPQGSVLGPLIFSIYVNNFPEIIDNCQVHMYADDVQVYVDCKKTNMTNCIMYLNSIMDKINLWAKKNSLKLNPSKSKCIVIYKRPIDTSNLPQIKLSDQNIEYVTSVRNLGIVFDHTLSWNSHITSTIGKTYGMLRSLWTTQYFTPIKVRMLLAKTFLLPTLLFGCEIYANCDSIRKERLNVLFNDIARYIYGIKRNDHISGYAKQIYGITFKNYLNLRVLSMLHKIIYTKEPSYLYNRLKFSRSTRNNNLIHPLHNTLIAERQFFVYSARLWNLLSTDLQRISNNKRFKNAVLRDFQVRV